MAVALQQTATEADGVTTVVRDEAVPVVWVTADLTGLTTVDLVEQMDRITETTLTTIEAARHRTGAQTLTTVASLTSFFYKPFLPLQKP